MVVEDVSIDDSPLRPAPVLVVRVRRRRVRCVARVAGASAPNTTTGRRTAMAPPGLRLLWGRAHGLGAARGVRGAWGGGRPSAVGGAGQPVHQGFRDGVRVADGGRQPEDRGRIPTHRVEDRR